MGKIALSIVQSVDGFIANQDDSFDFIEGYPSPELKDLSTSDDPYNLEAFFDAYDIVVMGNASYKMGFASDFPNKTIYVVTNQDRPNEGNLHFVKPGQIVKLMLAKKKQDHNIYLYGGGVMLQPFMAADAIDEYIIGTVPIILGKGKALFYELPDAVPLQLSQVDVIGGMTIHIYHRRPQ
ncbi:dihydrofolate reductase [Aerococcus agrisoli]|uniref:Dihydrofolate reductase n=1 Tax=Aerococcus agrisoli TaxID=2487350 RepID=A0A3N4GGG8_9LACT|nr:dihydrofolate reductase family protein [Aerococcus agrisoli]RPA60497.1 dihydrofolate reductase [Aerococcus agrisoli]